MGRYVDKQVDTFTKKKFQETRCTPNIAKQVNEKFEIFSWNRDQSTLKKYTESSWSGP